MPFEKHTRWRMAGSLGRVYPIVDVDDRAGITIAQADAILKAHPPYLQLRAKRLGTGALIVLARVLVARANAARASLIINDRLDVAIAAGAAGVHLGQEDLPIEAARRLAPPDMLIGVSTHSVDEARRAEGEGADYIGFGPMFATSTKADALPPRTLDELGRVRAAIDLPIVAIGGITEQRAQQILDRGADAVAMIGALASAADPAALTRRLLALRPRRAG